MATDSQVYRKQDTPGDSDKIGASYGADGKFYQKVILCNDEGVIYTVDLPVATPGKGFEITPTLDTGAYVAGDVLFATVSLTDAVLANGGTAALHSISILDKSKINGAFDIGIAASNIDVGTANSALAMSDAEAVDLLHYIEVVSGDYIDVGAQSFVPIPNIGMGVMADSAVDNLYMFGVSQDTKTYAADDLVIRLYFMQDQG